MGWNFGMKHAPDAGLIIQPVDLDHNFHKIVTKKKNIILYDQFKGKEILQV